MSLLSKVVKASPAYKMLTSGTARKVEKAISGVVPHEHSADRRANMYATREQIGLYQEQKEELHKRSAEASEQKANEAQKLHKQQIRSMRGSYARRSRMMSSPSSGGASTETSDKLG